jgi:hypothetical protein
MTESKPAQKDGESGQETIEEVEGPDSADADEINRVRSGPTRAAATAD